MLSRRKFVAGLAGFFLIARRVVWGAAPSATPMTVYKSKSCGCCAKWVEHVEAGGFDVRVHDEETMDERKDQLGVPQAVRSCHTAVVAGYLIEGHVPAVDIRQLLATRPKAAGLAVPGMPSGTPGMAESESLVGDFDVLLFQSSGSSKLFTRH